MAEINESGNILGRCRNCRGSLSTFEWLEGGRSAYGAITKQVDFGVPGRSEVRNVDFRLFRCAGCGRGALGVVKYTPSSGFPGSYRDLIDFYPEAHARATLPKAVPDGIQKEFREAEACMDGACWRAAAGLFRSVLDKTMRANGYKVKNGTTLEQQIDLAAQDGVITAARRLKAHQDIRVLGNDVLHDEWRAIDQKEVEPAHHYAQRILEDLYDDRQSVLKLLWGAGRVPAEGPDPSVGKS